MLMNPIELIYDLQSHPENDDIILSTSKDGSVRLWNVNDGVCLVIFEVDATVAVSIMFSRKSLIVLNDFYSVFILQVTNSLPVILEESWEFGKYHRLHNLWTMSQSL